MNWKFGHSGVTKEGTSHRYAIPVIHVTQTPTNNYDVSYAAAYAEALPQVPAGCIIWYGMCLAPWEEVLATFGEL